MPTKTLSIISAVLTVVFLIVLGLVAFFSTLLALNGYGDSEGTAAVVITLVCQGVGLILAGVLAGWLTRLFIEKFNWNKILAVIVSVSAGSALGTILVFAALLLSIIAAEAMWQAR
jgi:membrane protease YdiL (CAAX protease family)